MKRIQLTKHGKFSLPNNSVYQIIQFTKLYTIEVEKCIQDMTQDQGDSGDLIQVGLVIAENPESLDVRRKLL